MTDTPGKASAPTAGDVEAVARERADWLLDAVAGATQDRRFLRGDPAYDEAAGEAILLNGAKAIRTALERAAMPSRTLDEASERASVAGGASCKAWVAGSCPDINRCQREGCYFASSAMPPPPASGAGEVERREYVRGTMNDGRPAIFKIEQSCGENGFMGKVVDGPPGVVCKPGYVPWDKTDGLRLTLAEARAAHLNAAIPPPSASGAGEGYADTFYEIAEMLGMTASFDSPKVVWERDMRPRLRAALSPTGDRLSAKPVADENGPAHGPLTPIGEPGW